MIINMNFSAFERKDYDLILKLDYNVYPVSIEDKINNEIIDQWYSIYKEYGMIYYKGDDEDNVVAVAINIPMPLKIWYSLLRGECFENTLNIQWNSPNETRHNERIKKDKNTNERIGIHIYHIEVLQRDVVGHGFYKRMFQDLSHIAHQYNHQIDGFSGYCVTPEGNYLFDKVLSCRNVESTILPIEKSIDITNENTIQTNCNNSNNSNNNNNNNNNKEKTIQQTSEFIVFDQENNKRKIVECPIQTDITQSFLDKSVQPPRYLPFISKCNMYYCERQEVCKVNKEKISCAWNYL